jgi:hypothetical protein
MADHNKEQVGVSDDNEKKFLVGMVMADCNSMLDIQMVCLLAGGLHESLKVHSAGVMHEVCQCQELQAEQCKFIGDASQDCPLVVLVCNGHTYSHKLIVLGFEVC